MDDAPSVLKTDLNTQAFTLFEVIISIVILSVALMALIRLGNQNDNLQTYNNLQQIQNTYYESEVVEQTDEIKLVQDNF
jgi:prepilin-type N-terminal cleavage/methylation domain-containing protein